jgi:hypothetical protein
MMKNFNVLMALSCFLILAPTEGRSAEIVIDQIQPVIDCSGRTVHWWRK